MHTLLILSERLAYHDLALQAVVLKSMSIVERRIHIKRTVIKRAEPVDVNVPSRQHISATFTFVIFSDYRLTAVKLPHASRHLIR